MSQKIRVVGGGVPIPGYSRLVVTENGGVCGVTFGKSQIILVTARLKKRHVACVILVI